MTKNISEVSQVRAIEIDTLQIKGWISTAYDGSIATRKLLCRFAGVTDSTGLSLENLKDVVENYIAWCYSNKMWLRKIEVGKGKSEQAAGYKAMLEYAGNILKASPGHAKGLEYLKAAKVCRSIMSMASDERLALKKPAASLPGDAQPDAQPETGKDTPKVKVDKWERVGALREAVEVIKAESETMKKDELIQAIAWISEFFNVIAGSK